MKAVSALDVARAALMEVGGDPSDVWAYPDPLVVGRQAVACSTGNPLAWRAILLGRHAACGPEFAVRCLNCADAPDIAVPCTPVRDVLRGVTCGRVA